MVFPRPMVGRDNMVGFFGEFMGSVSPGLRFVIDVRTTPPPSASPGTSSGRGGRSRSAGAAASTAASPTRSGSSRSRSCMAGTAWSRRPSLGNSRWWPSGDKPGFSSASGASPIGCDTAEMSSDG